MVGAALVMALFYWAYQKERNLFVTIFAAFMFAYALYVHHLCDDFARQVLERGVPPHIG